ncbi:MAG: hypothetical protein AAB402_04250 [Patescibacteria group bacterium]
MGTKKALVLLAMAREGRGNSMAEVNEAQRKLGVGLGRLRTGRTPSGNRFLAVQTDDEDLSDQAVA